MNEKKKRNNEEVGMTKRKKEKKNDEEREVSEIENKNETKVEFFLIGVG